ncbi:MAG: bifunctional SulP family inorganic anion transporter/carbonic anhydrase [Verrucomicrobiales bacterium]
MHDTSFRSTIARDALAGLVISLVALPLCLGIAQASGVPPMSGLIAGIIGGVIVGSLSGSHISVSGPAAGLTAVILAQIANLDGDLRAFSLVVLLSGAIQLGFAALRAGFFSNYIPNNVIKGLLAAIGLILILKQLPHLVGHDAEPEGAMAFEGVEGTNTFSMLARMSIDWGACIVGIVTLGLILFWDHSPLKKLLIPSALLAVLVGVAINGLFALAGSSLAISPAHLINLPLIREMESPMSVMIFPDFSQLSNPAVYLSAITIAIVGSLETLLNIEAADKLDTYKRATPPNRELFAQGVGNACCGLLGGIPVTSVIVRSSVNASSGSKTRAAAIIHGLILLAAVIAIPGVINLIPLSALAAILIATGFKLASPTLFKRMYQEGWKQFLPFAATVTAILFTDLLTGILIGLAVSTAFILHSNLRKGVHLVREKHLSGEIIRIQLASQVSFLNRAALATTLEEIPSGSQVVIDARTTDYIDPDIHALIRKFRNEEAEARNIKVSVLGFMSHYELDDEIQYVDVSTKEAQNRVTPQDVLDLLKEGNRRFVSGERLYRDLARQVNVTSTTQHPMAVVLGCMDSRASTELVFDLGLGDIFTIRQAGGIGGRKALGSIEYGCKVAGSKLVVVLGHTGCGAVTAACDLGLKKADPGEATGLENIGYVTEVIQESYEDEVKCCGEPHSITPDFVDRVAERNVLQTMAYIRDNSQVMRDLLESGQIAIVGAMYDIRTGKVTFFEDSKIESSEGFTKQEVGALPA